MKIAARVSNTSSGHAVEVEAVGRRQSIMVESRAFKPTLERRSH